MRTLGIYITQHHTIYFRMFWKKKIPYAYELNAPSESKLQFKSPWIELEE